MQIRPERPSDTDAIRHVTEAAFKDVPYSDRSEPNIIEMLRSECALTLSLVAVLDGDIVGHVAFSRVQIGSAAGDWYGLGPISVLPKHRKRGIGQALICTGLEQLKMLGAAGCVLLGDPGYYGRFGFESDAVLTYGGKASPYLQRLVFQGAPPSGEVRYHRSFG